MRLQIGDRVRVSNNDGEICDGVIYRRVRGSYGWDYLVGLDKAEEQYGYIKRMVHHIHFLDPCTKEELLTHPRVRVRKLALR